MNQSTESLLRVLDSSPCNFLAAANVAAELDRAGFTRLRMADHWDIAPEIGRAHV